jgi:MFS family permease
VPDWWQRYHPNRLFYGWYIVLCGTGSHALMFGIVIVGMGTFFEPMRKELGWSAAALGAGQSIKSAESGLLSPVSGYLVDRFGPRRLAFTGVIVLSGGLALMSTVHSLWLFYLSSVVIALGQSLGGYTAFSIAIVRWFSRNRGKAIGLMNGGNGVGFFMAPLVALLVTALGWRDTLLVLSAVYLVVGLLLAAPLRARPEPYGYLPDGDRPDGAETGEADASSHPARPRFAGADPGVTVAEVFRIPAFYLMILAYGSGVALMSASVVFQIPHLENSGFSLKGIGLFLAVYGGLQVTLRFGVGWLGDSIGRRRIYLASFLALGLGSVAFANVSPDRIWLLGLYAVIFGFGQAGFAMGATTLIADYFGTRRFGTIRGLTQSLAMPASVLTPILIGRSFDVFGDYHLAFLVLGAVSATGILWVGAVRRPVLTPSARS